MPMTAPFRERTEDGSPTGPVLYTGVHANDAAALTFCASTGVNLTRADLRNRDLRNANVSGLIAPKCDLRGANCLNWTASALVAGRRCELSASILDGAVITGDMTFANLACTQPTAMRVSTGASTNLRGVDWSRCPDALEMPLPRAEITRRGRCVALRNGGGWRLFANSLGVFTKAQALAFLAANPDYAAVLTYLDSPECTAAMAAIDGRAVGTGPVVRPPALPDQLTMSSRIKS